MSVDERRTRPRNEKLVGSGPVVYWMQRDQRAEDNWALLYAQEQARARGVPLCVVFNLVTPFGETTYRHYDFMCRGLAETESDLASRNIPFVLTRGEPEKTIPEFVRRAGAGEVVVDFNPLRFTSEWRNQVAAAVSVRLTEVDAHNIIPCWEASGKEEFAAHTFRPKVHKRLSDFLTDFPPLHEQVDAGGISPTCVDWEAVLASLDVDRSVAPVTWLTPGTQAGKLRAQAFIADELTRYASDRNDPNQDALSDLSPYFHFGQLAPQWVAYAVTKAAGIPADDRTAYLEELIVRRELTDNFCYYNREYDSVDGAHEWAQKTIRAHTNDTREYVYERRELEQAETHDELWNAMQRQLVRDGKMHGWCRMYWAKKILEWSPSHQTAIDRALYLNDKYELDGTDPNGIVGVMWSIAGVHDRAWTERPVFGKIRYMNYNGAKRKFDVDAYIARFSNEQTLFA